MALVDGFSHLVVQVTDLNRSEKFYREVLGLHLVGRDLVNEEGPNLLLKMRDRWSCWSKFQKSSLFAPTATASITRGF
jgi:catechol 2,3-dioxygenase-like lactoylglutathione lyase family enzyme